jgi:hypothetical protein
MSFKALVKVHGEPGWHENAMRFATHAEAHAYAAHKMFAWTQVADIDVQPSIDAPNYTWVAGTGAVRIEGKESAI